MQRSETHPARFHNGHENWGRREGDPFSSRLGGCSKEHIRTQPTPDGVKDPQKLVELPLRGEERRRRRGETRIPLPLLLLHRRHFHQSNYTVLPPRLRRLRPIPLFLPGFLRLFLFLLLLLPLLISSSSFFARPIFVLRARGKGGGGLTLHAKERGKEGRARSSSSQLTKRKKVPLRFFSLSILPPPPPFLVTLDTSGQRGGAQKERERGVGSEEREGERNASLPIHAYRYASL